MRRFAVDRMACVDVRALPVQLLLRRHPEWRALPVVVVDRDKPSGVVQWANKYAQARRVAPGMRYAAALSLACELRGGVVTDTELDDAVALLTQRLWDFSPQVEPSARERGVFWLDASGMRHLYPSLEVWAARLRDDLQEAHFHAGVAVGFTRFGSYGAAKANTHPIVFQTPEEEHAYLRRVSIEQIGLTPELRNTLFKLGIDTLGGFIDLPAPGIRKRFGAEAAELYRLARNDGWTPLDPQAIVEPVEASAMLDYPEENLDRLQFQFAALLVPMLAELASRHEKLKALRISMTLDDHSECHAEITPAMPTLDANQVLSLVRLRMDTVALSAGVEELTLTAASAAAAQQQLALFHDAPRGSLDAVYRALAKVRTELGDDAVVVARLQDGHLPEARYAWERLRELPLPKPTEPRMAPLVRRIYTPPIELAARGRGEPDGWIIARIADGPVEETIGPHVIAGGWWGREVSRTYYYVRTKNGRWLWIYYDQKRRRWYLQGEVQ